jgi:hypothetical protein
MSSDGSKQSATVDAGLIYSSTDSGQSWSAADTTARTWRGIAMNWAGTQQIAANYGEFIYLSTDYGTTWSALATTARNWKLVAISSDGTKMAGAVTNGAIYVSTNAGLNWSADSSGITGNWYGLAMSADGARMSGVIIGNASVYVSSNSGATFVAKAISIGGNWTGIAMSSDGSKQGLSSGARNGSALSVDYGFTWKDKVPVRYSYFGEGALGSDGTKQALANTTGLTLSTNSGASFYQSANTGYNFGITMTPDGSRLIASAGAGGNPLSISTNGGVSWNWVGRFLFFLKGLVAVQSLSLAWVFLRLSPGFRLFRFILKERRGFFPKVQSFPSVRLLRLLLGGR